MTDSDNGKVVFEFKKGSVIDGNQWVFKFIPESCYMHDTLTGYRHINCNVRISVEVSIDE